MSNFLKEKSNADIQIENYLIFILYFNAPSDDKTFKLRNVWLRRIFDFPIFRRIEMYNYIENPPSHSKLLKKLSDCLKKSTFAIHSDKK